MSIWDDFRNLAATLLEDEFGVDAVLSRVTSTYDEATDTRSNSYSAVQCRAVITPRRIVAENGLIVVQTVAKLNVEPKIGDELSMGKSNYSVTSVEEVAPDGGDPIIWMAVLK